MIYLIFTLTALVLLVGFYALTRYEVARGARYFATYRARIDKSVNHIVFIYDHVDFKAFFREESRRLLARIGHAIVHGSLNAVRSVEHVLTRLVRHLRSRHAVDAEPSENTREFVKTLADFKDSLKQSQPEVAEIV